MFGELISTMGLVYLILWGGFLWFSIAVAKAHKSHSWPKSEGRVTKSEVKKLERLSEKGGKATLFNLDFEYQYKVDGKQYYGNKVRFFHMDTSSDTFPKKIQCEHPVGSKIVVRFDPSQPNKSVIQPGNNSSVLVVVLFFALSIGSMSVAFYLN